MRRAVALATWKDGKLLLVRRPLHDPEFPGALGLPAVRLEPGEDPEEGARRVAREKLLAEVEVLGPKGHGVEARPGYTLELWVYEGRLLSEPRLPEPKPGRTYYTELVWGAPEDLWPAARMGSLCSRLYLEAQ
ncbi:NUDIX hydrolase [Thermus oshimai]